MQVVDSTIANVAIPTIAGNLGASYSQGTWVITSYSAANAIVLPLTGKLARGFGEVRVFTASALLFSLASFLCGLAPDLTFLVLFRIFQGAAGGPMIPLAQTLLMNNYPTKFQVLALALWSATVSVAPVVGPVLGGFISDNHHWSRIFFINVPLGVLVAALVHPVLGPRESPVSKASWSALSFAFLAVGVGSLQLLLDKGKELDWFNSDLILGLGISSVVGITFLIAWEKHNPNPLMDPDLFKHRNFTVGATLISLGMMLYLGTVVLLPLLLQTHYGYTATWAGLATAPVGILPVLLTPVIGRFGGRGDPRIMISAGFLVFALCMLMRTGFAPGADLKFVVIPQFVQGLALALFFVPITSLAFIGLEPSKMAGASGLFNCLRTLFGGIGASVATTLWERREAFHHSRLVESIDGLDPEYLRAMEGMNAAGLGESEALGNLSRQITAQGHIFSAAEIYMLCAVCFVFLIAVTWLAKTKKPAAA
jgi:DHA2 family multidrug resistance protein